MSLRIFELFLNRKKTLREKRLILKLTVQYLHLQNKKCNAIYKEMHEALGSQCLCRAQIYNILREVKEECLFVTKETHEKEKQLEEIDIAISDVLEEFPHSTCRSIAEATGYGKSTINCLYSSNNNDLQNILLFATQAFM